MIVISQLSAGKKKAVKKLELSTLHTNNSFRRKPLSISLFYHTSILMSTRKFNQEVSHEAPFKMS